MGSAGGERKGVTRSSQEKKAKLVQLRQSFPEQRV